MPRTSRTSGANLKLAEPYTHYDTEAVALPEVGVQAQFRKKLPPKKYRYDPTLDPELSWNEAPVDGQVARLWDQAVNAETLEEAQAALRQLNQMASPTLRWAGNAERPEFSVPTLPLFVHERLSTQAILKTLQGHQRDKQMAFDMFGDAQLPITDRVLKAYEHKDRWVNRMILGDSLQVMNSLLEYESLGGGVQMIYMDPPYGVKFGSNFQPFVRKRSVSPNADSDLTREPEMVQAYRDTWELGIHSYLSYMRDRLIVARDLLAASGSIFVQISDENVHLVRKLMDDIFGSANFQRMIVFRKTGGLGTRGLKVTTDFLLWYAKDSERMKFRQLYLPKVDTEADAAFQPVDRLQSLIDSGAAPGVVIPSGATAFMTVSLTSSGTTPSCIYPYEFNGRVFNPVPGYSWKPNQESMDGLKERGRLIATGSTLRWVYFREDFPASELTTSWDDTGGASDKLYVVQTSRKVVERAILMTTDPGDLVLDPTCGSGTSAFVAEHWGRRWITIDVSRVPIALARQRLLTATFPYFRLRDGTMGLTGGFAYETAESTSNRAADGCGIVQHVTLRSIANDEPPDTEVLVDRPERDYSIARVSGPFAVEATIPTPIDIDGDGEDEAAPEVGSEAAARAVDYFSRMFETLRRVRRVRLPGGSDVDFDDIRQPAGSLTLSAEAKVTGSIVGIVFGPENGAVSERLVYEAAREAYARSYADLYVFGFAIEPNARQLIENCLGVTGIHANYVAVTPDIAMGDLLKNQRASQVFSIAGLPDVRLVKEPEGKYRVELLGLDTFDPATMETASMAGEDVPAWFLDTNYNAQGCFVVDQAFFPRTSAWEALRKDLRGAFDESVWAALSGTISEPFTPGETGQVAVKVVDQRGNELVVALGLNEPEEEGGR